jgi:two-component system phosphate regulon response regulator OmpR
MTRICKVLVVEDDEAVRAVLGDVFEEEGYGFTLVADGAAMREALDGDDYDIVVLDISLRGGESGFDLAQEAKRQGCGVILTSGDPAQFTRMRDSEWHTLAKPFQMRHLTALADQILQEIAVECVRRTRSDGSAFPARP